jgi:hypothetical protein
MNATQIEALGEHFLLPGIAIVVGVLLIMIGNDVLNLYFHKTRIDKLDMTLVNKLDTLQNSIDELRADINKGQSVDALREELKDLKRRID